MSRSDRIPARRGAAILAFCAVIVCLLAPGCATNDYIKPRRKPFAFLSNPAFAWARPDPRPTPRTNQLLRRFDVVDEDRDGQLVRLQQEIERFPTAEKLYSLAELANLKARQSEAYGSYGRALDMYGAAVAHAYWYLFDPQYSQIRNPYDPQFQGATQLYNSSLEAALRLINRQGQFLPGAVYTLDTGSHRYEIQVVSRGKWHDEDFAEFKFASDYDIKGLAHRHQDHGLGVPLIAVRRPHTDQDPAERYYPDGLSFPVTAFLRVMCRAGEDQRLVRRCVLELHDPLQAKHTAVAATSVPLQTDLTTPLAYFLDTPEFREQKNIATGALLRPESADKLRGLFMVEPYDPNKIPVVMIHGLWASPVTWMEMFNELRAFPEISHQYQFWFYLYPTGQPFWVSARQMREHLAEARAILDPEQRTRSLDQMVLVGHSMGGLVARAQTIESRDDYWRLLSDQPFDELQVDSETRELLASTVFFRPNPSVRRVVTIGTPHHGSDFANDATRWLARNLIELPARLVSASQSLTRNNPGFFKDTELLTISTSVDSLSPDSPVLPVMVHSPTAPWTKYHNIIGLVPEKGIYGAIAAGSDGVVAYEAARMEDVASEITVPADHMVVHQHPRAILEVRRVLLEHQAQALAEWNQRPRQQLAGYEPNDHRSVVHAVPYQTNEYAARQAVEERLGPRVVGEHRDFSVQTLPDGRFEVTVHRTLQPHPRAVPSRAVIIYLLTPDCRIVSERH